MWISEDLDENTDFIWSSSNTAVADVSPDGLVTANGLGNSIVTVTDDEDAIVGQVYVRVGE